MLQDTAIAHPSVLAPCTVAVSRRAGVDRSSYTCEALISIASLAGNCSSEERELLVSVGVSHKRASLAVLDALTIRDLTGFYTDLRAVHEIELVVLQTCNRVEIFVEARVAPSTESILRSWALATRFRLAELQRLAEVRIGEKVVEHLVRLASGLESMIVGEPQILGQMREAVVNARSLGAGGPALSDLFDRAISAGAKIRAETGVGTGATTIGSAALKLAEEIVGRLTDLQVLLLGTGQVGVLVMKALKARKVTNVAVAGRSREKTESFCKSYGGTPIPFSAVQDRLPDSDLVLVATRSNNFLIDEDSFSRGREASGRRLLILDLSNPRNVSPEMAHVDGITLRTIDDLRGIAEEGLH